MVMCNDHSLLRKMNSHLKTKFKVTVGDVDIYVVMHITMDLPNHRLFMNHQCFTENLFVKYDFHNVNFISTPNDPHVHLSSPPPDDHDSTIPNFIYHEIVGSLLYLTTHSRPNIAQAVSVVAPYATMFLAIHCIAVKRIFKYLCDTTKHALCYSFVSTWNQVLLDYTDANYACDLNDCKNRTGFILFSW